MLTTNLPHSLVRTQTAAAAAAGGGGGIDTAADDTAAVGSRGNPAADTDHVDDGTASLHLDLSLAHPPILLPSQQTLAGLPASGDRNLGYPSIFLPPLLLHLLLYLLPESEALAERCLHGSTEGGRVGRREGRRKGRKEGGRYSTSHSQEHQKQKEEGKEEVELNPHQQETREGAAGGAEDAWPPERRRKTKGERKGR